jgi:hypothetical protein
VSTDLGLRSLIGLSEQYSCRPVLTGGVRVIPSSSLAGRVRPARTPTVQTVRPVWPRLALAVARTGETRLGTSGLIASAAPARPLRSNIPGRHAELVLGFSALRGYPNERCGIPST